MNLLSLIIIFLALLICGAIGFIAWELTAERRAGDRPRDGNGPGASPGSPPDQ